MSFYRNRADAADRLIHALPPHIDSHWLVIGLPRGGVPIAAAIAERLGAELDIVVVRKVGMPGDPELALAAVTGPDPGQMVVNSAVASVLGYSREEVRHLAADAIDEVNVRRRRWQLDKRPLAVDGRDVLIVDDGIATGATLRAAISAVRAQGADSVVAAAPVALGSSAQTISRMGVEVICPHPNESGGLRRASMARRRSCHAAWRALSVTVRYSSATWTAASAASRPFLSKWSKKKS